MAGGGGSRDDGSGGEGPPARLLGIGGGRSVELQLVCVGDGQR
jgi:hypothetical protein